VQKEVMAVYPAVLTEANEHQFMGIISTLPTTVRDKLELFQRVSIIRRVPLFSDVSDRAAQLEIAGALEQAEYEASEYVFQVGEDGRDMFFIVAGTVEVLENVDGVYEQVLGILGAGQWFGEAALTERTIRSVDVQAAEHCDILVLPRAKFQDIACRYESLKKALDTEARALARAYEIEHVHVSQWDSREATTSLMLSKSVSNSKANVNQAASEQSSPGDHTFANLNEAT
jgi:CRP-like cAMP-binding protein